MEKITREQAEAVQRMQDAIEAHLEAPISLDELAATAGYSSFHASRLFRQVVGITPSAYLRARRLAHAALKLKQDRKVNEVAAEVVFESHEGFTRAFRREFGASPQTVREQNVPLRLFTPRSARQVFLHDHPRQEKTMSEPTKAIFVNLIERPARKLILLRGVEATEYFAYCGEVGCDVWGTLLSLPGTLGEPMGLWLPETMRKPATSSYVMGVEVPITYSGPIPEGMEIIDLEPTLYLVFQGQPYPEEKMGEAIGQVWASIEAYNPNPIGLKWSTEAPRYQLAPIGERGYIEGRPVKRL